MLAYDEAYLAGAQRRLGGMIDFAVNDCGAQLGVYYRLFLASPLSRRFEAGDVAVVAGRSGEELALEVLDIACPPGESALRRAPVGGATPEYWCGWALAFYQWASGLAYSDIERFVPVEDVLSLYNPYHEMDVRQFCEKMDALVDRAADKTALQRRRLGAGLSQRQLAEAAGVPVRTLQQYEQKQKDINHARAEYVVSLARVLHCDPADLLERNASRLVEYATVGASAPLVDRFLG